MLCGRVSVTYYASVPDWGAIINCKSHLVYMDIIQASGMKGNTHTPEFIAPSGRA